MSNFNATEIATEAEEKGEDALSAVIFQALGAASVCWDDDRVFESERAAAIGDSVVAYLRERMPAEVSR
jgi:hypothetical protein